MKPIHIDWKNNYLRVFGIALLISFLFFLPFLIYDKGLFLYYGDFNVQQIPFYSLAHDTVQSGAMGWSWNTDLGSNFIGSYSFYLLGSPFFWITLLFPSGAVPYLMAPLLMLKFALTAVTGYAYIGRFTKRAETAMFGGLLYAFTGFNLYNVFFNHFNEAVLVFPLLLIAMEELIVNNRRGGFALTVALCCIVNYYFFFGQVLFCVLYFFVRRGGQDFRWTLRQFCVLAIEAVIGLLLSMCLLLPSAYAVLGNPRTGDILTGFDMLIYGNSQRYGLILSSLFFPPDIPARPNFFPDSNAKWSSVSLFLPVLSTCGVFAFFTGEKRHWAKTLLLTCFGICLIPVLNSAFSLFNYSYYARWFYMPLLIMAMVSCIALERHRSCFKAGIKWTALFMSAFLLIGILPKKENGELVWFSLPSYPERFWVYFLIAVVGILFTCVLVILTPRHPKFRRYSSLIVGVMTIITSCFMIFTGKLASGVEVEENGERLYYNQVVNEALNGTDKFTLPALPDEEFYRIDTFDELDNLGMFWRFPTINAFQSVVPASIMEYYDLIGGERGVASRPKPDLIGVRGLLSVRYRFISNSPVRNKVLEPDVGFSYYDTQNGFEIYQNDHFVPMGFTYDKQVSRSTFDSMGGFKDEILLRGILLEEEDAERFSDILPFLTLRETDYITRNDADYFEDCDARAASAVDRFAYDAGGFTSGITLDKENLVFFSVPWDQGWSAEVNGQPAEIVKANGGFMAVLCPAGENEIVFSYHTPGLIWGWLITAGGLLLFAGYLVLVRFQRKRHPEYAYRKNAHRAFVPDDIAPLQEEAAQESSHFIAIIEAAVSEEEGSDVATDETPGDM